MTYQLLITCGIIRKPNKILGPIYRLFYTYFFVDHLFGYEEITRQCGAKEVNGLIYKEGCETTKIPFKRKECYCKRSLCNSANHLSLRLDLHLAALFLFIKLIFE